MRRITIQEFVELWNDNELVRTPEVAKVNLNSSFLRQFTTKRIKRGWLSLSQLGKPAILLGMYKAKMVVPPQADNYQRLRQQWTFLSGDIFEDVFLGMYKACGGSVKWRQKEVEFMGVKGHIDAVVDGDHLVDCKALSSYGFEKFISRPFDDMYYQSQLQLYYQALKEHGVRQASWVVLNKGSARLELVEMEPDYFYEDRAEYILKALKRIKHPDDVKEYFEPPAFEVDFYTKRKAPPFSLRMELSPEMLEWVYAARDS